MLGRPRSYGPRPGTATRSRRSYISSMHVPLEIQHLDDVGRDVPEMCKKMCNFAVACIIP